MAAVTSNGPNLYANLAHRMRVALGEFDDTNRDLDGLVKELAEFKRTHLAQPAQAVDVGAIREVIKRLEEHPLSDDWKVFDQCADKLTRALTGEKE